MCILSEQEQLAANQSTNLDQTVDGETTGVTGSVMLNIYTFFLCVKMLILSCPHFQSFEDLLPCMKVYERFFCFSPGIFCGCSCRITMLHTTVMVSVIKTDASNTVLGSKYSVVIRKNFVR